MTMKMTKTVVEFVDREPTCRTRVEDEGEAAHFHRSRRKDAGSDDAVGSKSAHPVLDLASEKRKEEDRSRTGGWRRTNKVDAARDGRSILLFSPPPSAKSAYYSTAADALVEWADAEAEVESLPSHP
jgi:hypothetical protein